MAEAVDNGRTFQADAGSAQELQKGELPTAGPQKNWDARDGEQELLGAGTDVKGVFQKPAECGFKYRNGA